MCKSCNKELNWSWTTSDVGTEWGFEIRLWVYFRISGEAQAFGPKAELVVQYCFINIIWVLDWEEPGLTFRVSMTNGHKYVRFSCMRESLRVRSEWHYLKSPSTIMFWKWKQGMVAWKSSAKAKKWHNCIISNLSFLKEMGKLSHLKLFK